jgi:hypothetical protein
MLSFWCFGLGFVMDRDLPHFVLFEVWGLGIGCRIHFRAKSEHVTRCSAPLPESQCWNLALTVMYVPHSLDSEARITTEAELDMTGPLSGASELSLGQALVP